MIDQQPKDQDMRNINTPAVDAEKQASEVAREEREKVMEQKEKNNQS